MLTALIRTLILYFLIMLGLRLMGKRQIGELEPSELVLALLISDLAAVPMQDFGIPLLNGVVPILALLAVSMILSVLNLKSIRDVYKRQGHSFGAAVPAAMKPQFRQVHPVSCSLRYS